MSSHHPRGDARSGVPCRLPLTARALAQRLVWLGPAFLFLAAARIGFADEPTLYEKVALGPLVVHGRCLQAGRRALIEVRDAIKGSYAGPRLWVSYRSDNYNRAPGAPKISFAPGDESIFVLEPERTEDGRAKAPDRFVLAGGARGKIDLPPEGGPALLDAVRRIAGIQAFKEQSAIWDAQRQLVSEPNPILVRAGFEEVLKFRLGDESLVAPLLEHVSGPRPEFREMALKVIGQIFEQERRKQRPIPSHDLLVRETLAHASGDDLAEVRAEAVRALRQTRRADLVEPLERLAAADPSQIVRYEAELALMELRDSTGGSPAPPFR